MTTIDWRFLAALSGLTALAALMAWPLVGRLDGGTAGLLAGLGFSLASFAAGFHALQWSAERGSGSFVVAVLGSSLARVLALLAFALGLARAGGANLIVALVTVVAAHLVFGWFEIVYLHRTDALA